MTSNTIQPMSNKLSPLDHLEMLFNAQNNTSQVQLEAFTQLKENGLPTLRTERWKYTPLRKAIHSDLSSDKAELSGLNKHPLISQLLNTDKNLEIVQIVNGQLHGEFNNKNAVIQLSDDFLEPHDLHQDRFINQLNLAFLRNNYQLQITGQSNTLHVLHIHSTKVNDLNAYQLCIDADDNSEAKILILITADQQASTQVPVISIDAGKNSDIEIYYCQDTSLETCILGQTNAQLQRDAVVSFVQIELGGNLVRHNIIADALESGSEFNLQSLFIQKERQHIDTHLDMYHHAANTQATMLSKGILDDRSRCIFNGKIYVEKDAQLINANLNNDTLLLSKQAEINTKPELEIYADDVKCAHGATVGQLDEQAIFYLRSRGLSQEQAENTLTAAFARQIYNGIVPAELTEFLDQRLGFIET